MDSFGYSSVLAFLAKKAGLKHHIINRVDPLVKDHLVRAEALHFHWQQAFQVHAKSEAHMFTHTMPYSYQGCKDCGPVKEVRLCEVSHGFYFKH